MRVEGKRAARPRARVAAEAALDLGAMEQLGAVLRAKAEGEAGVVQRLAATTVAREALAQSPRPATQWSNGGFGPPRRGLVAE